MQCSVRNGHVARQKQPRLPSKPCGLWSSHCAGGWKGKKKIRRTIAEREAKKRKAKGTACCCSLRFVFFHFLMCALHRVALVRTVVHCSMLARRVADSIRCFLIGALSFHFTRLFAVLSSEVSDFLFLFSSQKCRSGLAGVALSF